MCIYMQSILFVLHMLLRPLGKQAYGTDVCAHRNARHNWSSSANTTRRRGIRRYRMAVSSATHLPSGPQKKTRGRHFRQRRSGLVAMTGRWQASHFPKTPTGSTNSLAVTFQRTNTAQQWSAIRWGDRMATSITTSRSWTGCSPQRKPEIPPFHPRCLEWHCKPSMWLLEHLDVATALSQDAFPKRSHQRGFTALRKSP